MIGIKTGIPVAKRLEGFKLNMDCLIGLADLLAVPV
jgi:hypothetical protein